MERSGKRRKEFKVVLEGIELSEEQERSLSAAIQQTVAGHLAELDFVGDGDGSVIELGGRFGEWIGRWIRMLEAAEREEMLEKVFQQRG
jgi:hypothetical protein